jgi:membrane protease YdiL (CAAX protease family)
LFAGLHFRRTASAGEVPRLVFLTAASAVIYVATTACALGLLRFRAGARASDFGWDRSRFWADVGLGAAVFLAVMPGLFGLQYLLKLSAPPEASTDPIPLFMFAAVLGLLYFRTHRIVPAVACHMALNVTSTSLFWLSLRGAL